MIKPIRDPPRYIPPHRIDAQRRTERYPGNAIDHVRVQSHRFEGYIHYKRLSKKTKAAAYSGHPTAQLYELSTNAPQVTRAIVPRVDYPKLETALLKDVDDRFYYGAYCQSCLYAARLNLSKLRADLGDDFPVTKIRERLKCERCEAKQVVVTYL